MGAFCPNCGVRLSEGVRFCSGCGKPVMSAIVPTPASSPQVTAPAPAATAASAKGGSNALVKILWTVLVLILLVALLVMGSCLYVTYRAKRKVDEIKQAYKSNDLGKLAGALGAEPKSSSAASGGKSSANAVLPSFPAWTPSTPDSQGRVPLRPGLTVVTALSQFGGDYESIKRIRSVTPDSVSLSYRADNPPNPFENLGQPKGASNPKPTGTTTAHRTVRTGDLRNAHEYMQWFSPITPDIVPGTTAISFSSEILSELKNKGETQFTFRAGGLKGAFGSLLGGLSQLGKSVGTPSEQSEDLSSLGKESCTLKRVGGVHAFPVLFNDQRVNLPAIHAQCTTENDLNDFYLLDDDTNPLALAWKIGGGDTLQVVKISYPPGTDLTVLAGKGYAAAGANGGGGKGSGSNQKIEQQLKQKQQVEVYGIYFDFASDQIKPESEPVLKEIADALQHNPSWKLRVGGHTDNIGGDAYNMGLSQHRAEAVKRALVTRYHIAPDRLHPVGFGATLPKESNDTLAGRARNRRVELVRE